MANKKVSQLSSKPSVLVTDLFPIADPSTGQLYKTTISDLGTAIGSGVSSVNGLVGAVVLDTDDIQELVSPTNKWFTDTRARAALSASSPLAYNSGTGVFSIPAATSSQNGYLTSTDWTTFNSKQAALSGTGFVKISGTTISYDNSTYALDSAVVKLTGDQTVAGIKTFSSNVNGNQFTVGTPTDTLRSFAAAGNQHTIALWLEEYTSTGGGAPDIFFNNGRGTISSKANIQVGDGLGGITFAGYVNANFNNSVSMGPVVVNIDSTNNQANADFTIVQSYNSSSTTENFRLYANGGGLYIRGNVQGATGTFNSSIAINNPTKAAMLTVKSDSTYAAIRITADGLNRFTIASSDATTNMWNIDNSTGTLRFFRDSYSATGVGTGGSVKLSITDSGAATFSSSVTANNANAAFNASNGGYYYAAGRIGGANSGNIFTNNGTGTNFIISETASNIYGIGGGPLGGAFNGIGFLLNTSTGAATFSSSVTANGVSALYNPNGDSLRIIGASTWNGSMQIRYVDTASQSTSYAYISVGDSGANRALSLQHTGGNVGIGTTAPGYNLHVNGTGKFNDVLIGTAFESILGSYYYTNLYYSSGFRVRANGYGSFMGLDSSNGDILFATTSSGTAGNTVSYDYKFTIKNDGKIGIGTTTPTNLLDLGGASAGKGITWENYSNVFSEYSSGALFMSSNFYGNIGASGYKTSATATFGAAGIKVSGTGGSGNSGIIQFYVDDAASKTAGASFTPTERMRITSGGDLLVGKSTTATNENGVQIYKAANGSGRINIVKTATGTNSAVANYHNGTYVGGIDYSDSSTSFPTSSDYRLKEDLKAINGLDIINKINVYNYKWKISEERTDGVLAHELAEVLPYAVSGIKDGDRMQGVDYSKIVPVMVQAIKEEDAKIIALQNKVTELETEIQTLKNK